MVVCGLHRRKTLPIGAHVETYECQIQLAAQLARMPCSACMAPRSTAPWNAVKLQHELQTDRLQVNAFFGMLNRQRHALVPTVRGGSSLALHPRAGCP